MIYTSFELHLCIRTYYTYLTRMLMATCKISYFILFVMIQWFFRICHRINICSYNPKIRTTIHFNVIPYCSTQIIPGTKFFTLWALHPKSIIAAKFDGIIKGMMKKDEQKILWLKKKCSSLIFRNCSVKYFIRTMHLLWCNIYLIHTLTIIRNMLRTTYTNYIRYDNVSEMCNLFNGLKWHHKLCV